MNITKCLSIATQKLWGGRFTNPIDSALEQLNASIQVDKRMYSEDINGSKAYCRVLILCKLLSEEEGNLICEGLDKIETEWRENLFVIKDNDEDIHTANERRLKELIGDVAAKLHTGRSRNDQVNTDMRLWLRSALSALEQLLKELVKIMVDRSYEEIDITMAGYTHLQRAQPVRWSHFLLSHAWNFKSDADKLDTIYKTTNVMSLGSGALAGNPFCIDRIKLAQDLGFEAITQNSMQAVGDRDFIAEFLFWSSLTGIHLSRLAEDLIIFSSKEFNFIEISDTFSTGSSLMPQKKNADSLELVRGIAGSLFGHCSSLMMTLKGLPSTYNKDLQNDKDIMFSAFDKLVSVLNVICGTIKTLKVNSNECRNALSFDMLATDLAYYLVRKGVSFRNAHHDVGKAIAIAEKRNICISDLTLEELQSINEHFQADAVNVWNYEASIEQYQTIGGTSRNSVIAQVDILKKWLCRHYISTKRS
ncbi:argininosuccinate lyase [Holotrichia oblita]|uniref:Argininosuccinate lyase n=1 Tax=Holotrichia oblita TaxID=644536 RepID=A0ACB9T3X4_HOLOL|nr:argininosuccinate lyase [Holotrichia oblita]